MPAGDHGSLERTCMAEAITRVSAKLWHKWSRVAGQVVIHSTIRRHLPDTCATLRGEHWLGEAERCSFNGDHGDA